MEKKPVQSLRRQQSLLKHRDNFDTIVQGALPELWDCFENIVSEVGRAGQVEAMKDVAGGRDLALEMMMTRLASDLQRKVDRFTHELLEDVWSKYDKNQDGSLQKPEMRNLVKSVFKDIYQNLGALIKEAMEPTADNLKEWIESDATGPMGLRHSPGSPIDIVMTGNVQARIETAAHKLLNVLDPLMTTLMAESDPLSDEIFDAIDANKDGNVTKREFARGFSDAFSFVVDFSKMIRKVLQQRPKLAQPPRTLTRSLSMVNETDYACAAVLTLAAASAALVLFLKRKH